MRFLKIESSLLFLISIGVIFQNLSLYNSSSFGLSSLYFLTILILCLKPTIFLRKINLQMIIFVILFVILFIITSFYKIEINYIRYVRSLGIISLIYIYSKYFQSLEFEKKNFFYKIYGGISLLLYFYGIYEFVSYYINMPLFLSKFSNNISYSIAQANVHFGGWIDYPRIKTVWFEPAAYSIFLMFNYFIYKEIFPKYNLKAKKIEYILLFINILMTFARTGIFGIIIGLIFYTTIKILDKFKAEGLKKILQSILIFLPLIMVYFMYISQKYIFNDLSSAARTVSPLFYLNYMLERINIILFGYGNGSIQEVYLKNLTEVPNLEGFAHNGYIQFIFENGLILFCFVIYLFFKKRKNNMLIPIIIPLCFGEFYNVESYIVLCSILLVEKFNEVEDKREVKNENSISIRDTSRSDKNGTSISYDEK